MADEQKDTHPNKGRPSGWVPEDLVNHITEISLAQDGRLIRAADEIKSLLLTVKRELMSDIARIEMSRKVSNDGLRLEMTTNQDALMHVTQETLVAVQETARGLEKIEQQQEELAAQVIALQTGHDMLAGQVSNIGEHTSDHDVRLATIEAWQAAQPTPEQSTQLIGVLMEQQEQAKVIMAHLLSHDVSRDKSIAERKELRADLEASKADRKAIFDWQARIGALIDELYAEMHLLRERRHGADEAANGG